MLLGTVYTHLVHTVPLTIWIWFLLIMEIFFYFYTTGNGVHTFGTHRSSYNMNMISANYGKFFLLLYYGTAVHTFGTHRSSYNMGMISANYGKFFVLLCYWERCTHIWYTPFLLQYGYDFCQLWKIFCTSMLLETVYTHLVHTVPLTIWIWFLLIMENFLYFYTTGNGVHTFGTQRSSYNMGMISANYGKFFVLLCYWERCTHIWYTPFLLQYEYDFC